MHCRTKLFARRFNFERLENRTLLAGNVTTNFVGGLLTLTGDAAANSIQLTQLSNGDWRVKGIGTKINGTNSVPKFTGVTDITTELKASNDTVSITKGTITGELDVDDGAPNGGNDTVLLNKFNVGGVDLDLADGNDTAVVTNCQVAEVLDFDMGKGNDVVQLSNSSADDLDVDGNVGNDVAVVNNFKATTSLDVDLGNSGQDNDVATVTNSSAGIDGIDVNVDVGSNVVTMRNCTSVGLIQIYVGGSNETTVTNVVSVSNCHTDDQFDISGSPGNDVFVVNNVTAEDGSKILADEGSNVISINKLNVLSGQTTIQTGDGNDVIAVTNSKFNSTGTTDTSPPFPVYLSIETNGGNDAVTMVNDTVIDGANINTGDGTDAVSLNKVNAAAIDVGLEGGNYDTLAVVNSTALLAAFSGGNNTGDTLVQSHNHFDTETHTGFDSVIG
jgi:hypothetical protein